MKIIEGSDGNMYPNDILSREQAVKIMLKALEAKGEVVSYNNEKSSFDDEESISDWAKTYVTTAVDMGLINGMENNRFMPQNSTLREQAMVMIYRLLKKDE